MIGTRLRLGEEQAIESILNEFYSNAAYPADQMRTLVDQHVDPMEMAFALRTLNMTTQRGVNLLATPLAPRLLDWMAHTAVPEQRANHLRSLERHGLLTAELADFSFDITTTNYGFQDNILGALITLNELGFLTGWRAEAVKEILKASICPELTADILAEMESWIREEKKKLLFTFSWESLCIVAFREKSKVHLERNWALLKNLYFHSLLNEHNLEALKKSPSLNCSMVNIWSKCNMLDQGYFNELMRLSPILMPDKEWEEMWIDLDVYHKVTFKHLLHILSVCRSNLNNVEQLREELRGYLKKEFRIGTPSYNEYVFFGMYDSAIDEKQQPGRNIIREGIYKNS